MLKTVEAVIVVGAATTEVTTLGMTDVAKYVEEALSVIVLMRVL